MTWIPLVLQVSALCALGVPVGRWIARVFMGQPTGLGRVLGPIERTLYAVAQVDPAREMSWKTYTVAMLVFNALGAGAVYAILRLQPLLPLNPDHLPAVSPDCALNTALSFATNTNWQSYGGESTMSHLSQMAALGVQNFVSAATGIAVLVAFVRGFSRRESTTIGNFWADLVRSVVYVLLPLSFVLAITLCGLGVVQSLSPSTSVRGLDSATVATQTIPLGPVASQVAIKQLGTNGGGFFNANSAHPFENPTPLTGFLELFSILLLPAALCFTFGRLVGDGRQGRVIFIAMMLLFVPLAASVIAGETNGTPTLSAAVGAPSGASVPNLEGKEVRFGAAESALWSAATTAASNGSVNAMHDSFVPMGGLVQMLFMQLGEVVFGGVGSGLYGMLVFAIIAVFIAGLMVGRTPEYLGKKIEAFEIKMASLVVLIPVLTVLMGTALAVSCEAGLAGIANPGPHGFSEILYAFSSAANNNGSAFAGLGANTPFYDTVLGVAMVLGRYFLAIPVLAIAGSLAAKKSIPAGPGTLPTHGVLFVVLLLGSVLLVAALTFVPALALGPIVEHLMMKGR